jgi:hypothetical protein
MTPYVAPFSPPFRENVAPPAITPVVPPMAPVVPPVAPQRFQPPQARALCRAEVNTATSAFPLTTIVECPAMMQPKRTR